MTLTDYIPAATTSETGLTYHWNRWRSENGANFISEDFARDGLNWYGYAGMNPIMFTDPDGRIQISKTGEYIFYRKTDNNGNPITETITGNSGKTIKIIKGYLKANDGTEIKVHYNLSRENSPEDNYDCHGLTFTKGTFWIDNPEIEKVLKGDEYIETDTPKKDDVLIQRNKNGDIIAFCKNC